MWHFDILVWLILVPNRAQSVFATVNCDSFVNLLPFNVLAHAACVMYRRLQLHGASRSLCILALGTHKPHISHIA